MRDLELAWAAGFFDGEGSCYVKTNKSRAGKTYYYTYLEVSQDDIRVLDRWQKAVGFGHMYKYKTTLKGNDHWQCRIYDQVEVSITIDGLWPFLSEKKKEQIDRTRASVQSHRNSISESNAHHV